MRLKPFVFSNTSNGSVNFIIPHSNVGLNVRIGVSSVPSCLSIEVCPIHLTRKAQGNYEYWQVMRQHLKEYCLPVHSHNPLLKELTQPFNHAEVGRGILQLVWNRHLLKITCDEKNKEFILRFKRMYSIPSINTKELKAVEVDEPEYILNITKAPIKEEYIEILRKENAQEIQQQTRVQRVHKERTEKKLKRRSSINRFLKFVGLQLLEEN